MKVCGGAVRCIVWLFLILMTMARSGLAATPSGFIRHYEPKTYANIRYPALDQIPEEVTVVDSVDERPLWNLLHAKRFDELSVELDRYRRWFPTWEPPVDLITSLTLGDMSSGVKLHKDKRAWQELVTLSEQHPEDFSCAKIHNSWALGEAYYTLGQGKALQSLYEKILVECTDAGLRLVTLQQAAQRLPYPVTADFISREQKKELAPTARTALGDVEYRFYAGWFANAVQRNANEEAERAAPHVREGISARRDAATASLLGWWALRKGRSSQAIACFTQALSWRHDKDLAYGLAVAWKRAKRLDQVRILADNWREEPRIARLLRAPEHSPIVLAYSQGRYRRSLLLAEAALRGSGKRQTQKRQTLRMLKAWSLFKLKAPAKAAEQFAEVYKASPSWESARGLVLCSQRSGNFERPQALARQRGGPLAILLQSTAPAGGPGTALYYDYFRSRLANDIKNKAYLKGRELVPRLAQRIVARRDGATALLVGWTQFNTGNHSDAEHWFAQALAWHPSAEAAHGLALTRRSAGDWVGAERVAQRWGHRYPETQVVGRDALLDRGDAAYAQKDYRTSLDYAQKSRRYGNSRRSDMLAAWSKHKLGERESAVRDFDRLYHEAPDSESANGWLTAAVANHQEQDLRAAATPDSPLQRRLRDYDTDDYFGRDLFILANTTRVEAHPELNHVDGPSVAVLPFARHRSGLAGLGHLDMQGLATQGRWGWGLHRFGLDVDWMRLDAGAVDLSAPVGSLGSARIPLTTTEESLLAPGFNYEYAGTLAPYFSLGSTPLGGVVDGIPVGRLGLRSRARNRFWDIGLFAQNIQQSILSISGLVDPTTGRSWGRVVERGGQGRIWQALTDRWSLTASGTLGQIVGHEVAENQHFGGHVALGFALNAPGFDYFTVGPAYGFEHYSDNRRYFTYGHGGYFSPDQFHKAGVEVNLQTTDARPLILRAYTALSYQHTDEADAPAFPLSHSGPTFLAGATDGVAFDANVAGVYSLSPHTQIGGFFDLVQSPNFTDIGGGLMLRVLFEPRSVAVSTDLPGRTWLP